MGLRIGIDARLNAYRGGGIPQYTRQLLAALAALDSGDTLIALQHFKQGQPLLPLRTVQTATLITPPHHRLEQWSLPAELLLKRLDVLHSPDFIAPRYCPCPAVVTIHDLAFLHYLHILDEQARRYYGRVRQAIWQASGVIAVSQATRHDIAELLEFPPERVDVVYEAPAPEFAPLDIAPGETRRFTRAYGAGKNHTISLQAHSFGLFVSTLEPRKNLPTLLRALHVCLNRRTYTPYRLVVAGARGWHEQAIFDAVRDLGLGDAVLFVGSVAPGDLRWLYNACVFYANPSLYEGFGLPVVEAMACGAPSLVANASSLPEVAGDAAILLPPEDVEAWADAMQRIWHDEALQAELSQRGQVQAGQFSWDRAARETLAVYRRAGRGAS